MRICIITLGCPKNVVESETLAGILKSNGYELTTDIENCDCAVIHTCSFIKDAKKESEDFINGVLRMKKGGQIGNVFVSGCLVQDEGKSLISRFPAVDGFIGTGCLDEIPDLIERGSGFICKGPGGLLESPYPRLLSSESASAFLRIAEGCNHRCSFCHIPMIRGRYRSRKIQSVVDEARGLSELGIKEAVLIAQDTTSYGVDLYGRYSLKKLIEKISEISGIEWIRILYGYPASVNKELLDCFRKEDKLCKYIDIPLQHISRRILKRMGRPSRSRETVEKIKNAVPDIAVRTSLIVGFPGETEKDYREMRSFVEEGWFDQLGVFEYSDDPKARSYGLKQKTDKAETRARKKELMLRQFDVLRKKNKLKIGSIEKVLVENRVSGSLFEGRASFQAPEVDGKIIFSAAEEPGAFVKVRITGQKGYDIIGQQVQCQKQNKKIKSKYY